jgi:hypothetical protein
MIPRAHNACLCWFAVPVDDSSDDGVADGCRAGGRPLFLIRDCLWPRGWAPSCRPTKLSDSHSLVRHSETKVTFNLRGWEHSDSAAHTLALSCFVRLNLVRYICFTSVVDGSGKPIQGATLHLVSEKGEPVTSEVITQGDGHFSLADTSKGNLSLAISAPRHNSVSWPLQVTAMGNPEQCRKPLTVHLAGELGSSCGDWVGKK